VAAEPSEGKGEYKRYGKKDPRLYYLSQAGEGVESSVTLSLIMNFKEQLRLFFFVLGEPPLYSLLKKEGEYPQTKNPPKGGLFVFLSG